MNVTAEVNATCGDRTEIVRINASREFLQQVNEALLSGSPEVRILINGVFRVYDERGDSMDISELAG